MRSSGRYATPALLQAHPPGAANASSTQFCLGAFKDALCLRRAHPTARLSLSPSRGSALRCLLSLSAIAMVVMGLGLLIPGVLARVEPSRLATPAELALIRTLGSPSEAQPAVTIEQYQSWRAQRHLLSGLCLLPGLARVLRAGSPGRHVYLRRSYQPRPLRAARLPNRDLPRSRAHPQRRALENSL